MGLGGGGGMVSSNFDSEFALCGKKLMISFFCEIFLDYYSRYTVDIYFFFFVLL